MNNRDSLLPLKQQEHSDHSQQYQPNLPKRSQRLITRPKNQELTKKTHDISNVCYIPPERLKMSQVSAPQFQGFKGKMLRLMQMKEKQNVSEKYVELCFQIYISVLQRNGIVQVSSINQFLNIVNENLKKSECYQLENQEIEDLRQILFSYEFTQANPDCQLKIYQLGMVNFISKSQLKSNRFDIQKGIRYFLHDTTLFQEGADALDIDKYIFNLDYMARHYSNQSIDIRIQNPCDYGFNPHKLKNRPYKMTLGEYRFYQQNFLDPKSMASFKHISALTKGQIFFGVNFEPTDKFLEENIKKYVGNTFLDFHSQFDLLSYLDSDVPGCSSPQMYFKVPGCWTGGHQENVSMSALNINHGPDYSQWYTLQLKYVQKLRSELNQLYKTDLYVNEGLWYQKLDWFIKKGYPVKRFLQRRDDIVITGPGTLHWVRSFGVALQTSWNIMFKSIDQLEAAFMRQKFNKQVKFSKSATIPLKGIIVKYLNHERTIMSAKIRQLCVFKLREWLQQEEQFSNSIIGKIHQRDQFYLKDLQSFCSLCNQQILLYYLPAPKQIKQGISCLECFIKKNQAFKISAATLYMKHSPFFMWKLITICEDQNLNMQFKYQLEELCKGDHVGKIGTYCRIKEKKLSQQTFLCFKENREVKKVEREILYGNNFLFQLYGLIEGMKNLEPKLDQLATYNTKQDRPREAEGKFQEIQYRENSNDQQSANKIKKQQNCYAQKIDCECQTDKVIIKEIDELSEKYGRSRSREKKKKKSKHTSRNRSNDSPRFSKSNSRGSQASRRKQKTIKREEQIPSKYYCKNFEYSDGKNWYTAQKRNSRSYGSPYDNQYGRNQNGNEYGRNKNQNEYGWNKRYQSHRSKHDGDRDINYSSRKYEKQQRNHQYHRDKRYNGSENKRPKQEKRQDRDYDRNRSYDRRDSREVSENKYEKKQNFYHADKQQMQENKSNRQFQPEEY